MKDLLDTTAAPSKGGEPHRSVKTDEADEGNGFANRKLIRPTLNVRVEHGDRAERARPSVAKKLSPPEQTFAESFYYQKQMQSRTLMTVVLHDGEELRGVIEWYDKDCIKLNRTAHQPNLLIYKSNIKYVFKQAESNGKK